MKNQSEATPKTVRVRIAVIVDDEGDYCSAGWKCRNNDLTTDEDLISSAFDGDCTGLNTRIYFIEADLPLPVSETFEATVVEEVKE